MRMCEPYKLKVETVMNGEITLDIAPGKKEFIRLSGGTLIVSELDNFIPPIGCTKKSCDELADFFVAGISNRDKDSDRICYLCDAHLKELVDLKKAVPYELFH